MPKKLSKRQEHKRRVGEIWGLVLDLEYQQETLRTVKLQLPPECREQENILVSLMALRVHLEDAGTWAKKLMDQVRLAQDESLTGGPK